MQGTLIGIQVGNVQRLVAPANKVADSHHPFWTSGIFKCPITGKVRISSTGIEGDQQSDLENHGGPDNVVLAYDADHYPIWKKELNLPDLPFGSFGENFTVSGFSDDTVCIADTWQIGSSGRGVILQVTQPRQPCWKLARRLQRPDIVQRIHKNSWGGWYLRVLQEGCVEPGMPITLVDRKHPDWPVAKAVQIMYVRKQHPVLAKDLAQLPELSARWKAHLAEMD